MKYSQILRETADIYLPDGTDSQRSIMLDFSCVAIVRHPEVRDMHHPIFTFLCDLGCNVVDGKQFNEFSLREKRQGARFLWLNFAALVAEDMGI